MNIARITFFLSFFLAAAPVIAQVDANFCGPIAGPHVGPWDYRADHYVAERGDQSSHEHKRGMVEGAHFTQRVELLIGGKSAAGIGAAGQDLNYTLHAFPNHHRALMSVMKYGEKVKSDRPDGLKYTVECYFERAVRFKANDTIVKMLYATYLIKHNRVPEAVSQLERATVMAKDAAFTHYNIGLVYFDMKNYGRAQAQAHQAMALGFERTELRDLLKGVNQWQDPKTEANADVPVQPASQPAGLSGGDAPTVLKPKQ